MPNLFTDEDKNILFEGVDIEKDNQTEFMVKMESMITSKVSELKEEFESEKETILEEAKTQIAEDMESKVDSYLDYVVETWVDDNELALESGIKMDIMEGFVTGLKGLYEEHNINLDEESVDVVAKSDDKINSLQEDLANSIEKNAELKETLEDFKRGIIIDTHSNGLTESEKEKLNTLVEGVEYSSDETFNEKVKIIRNSYFTEEKDEDDDDEDDDDSTDKKIKKKKVEEMMKDGDLNESYISNLAKLL